MPTSKNESWKKSQKWAKEQSHYGYVIYGGNQGEGVPKLSRNKTNRVRGKAAIKLAKKLSHQKNHYRFIKAFPEAANLCLS